MVSSYSTVEGFSKEFYRAHGAYLFHLGDEFYLKAGLPLPCEERYEEYPQLENGVGMITSFRDEFLRELSFMKEDGPCAVSRTVSVATGEAAYPLIEELSRLLMQAVEGLTVHVYPIKNRFFGPEITVSGLLTGKDMLEQLRDKPLGEALCIPRNSLRNEGDLFLCGMSREELASALSVAVCAPENNGADFLHAILGDEG
jgi:NifB/MoaA-like Fe-S oxidoreductase